MRVLVCGDRNWTDRDTISRIMGELHAKRPIVVCHGACSGADTIVGQVARLYGIPVKAFPAKWAKYGKRAGPIRNRQMLTVFAPDLVLAFHADIKHSRGTADMVRAAQEAGVFVRIVTGSQGGLDGD